MNDLEEILNVEVIVPQLEYTTHEQYTMQQEREANRKLKAQIRMRRKFAEKGKIAGSKLAEYPLTPDECYE